MSNWLGIADDHTKRAIESNIPLIDVLQGVIKNALYEWDSKEFSDQSYKDGYTDCLTDLYTLCYDVIFYKQDLEKSSG
jgi:hypothetical protein